MNEATKMWKMLFHVTEHCSVLNLFKLVITFHYFYSIMVLQYEQMSFVKCTETEETKGISKQFD